MSHVKVMHLRSTIEPTETVCGRSLYTYRRLYPSDKARVTCPECLTYIGLVKATDALRKVKP